MKWIKPAAVIVVFVAAMYFAYMSFESSFNPRRGHENESGQHPPSPAMASMMQKMNQKKREDANKKASAVDPDKKGAPGTAPSKKQTQEQIQKNGGD